MPPLEPSTTDPTTAPSGSLGADHVGAAGDGSAYGAGAVIGRYTIDHELGRGGMGVVWAAREQETGRVVALKLLAQGLNAEADRQRFLREGHMAAAIDHPHVVYVYRTEDIDGRLVIAMELVGGGTLEHKVAQRGPLPWVEAVQDMLQVIAGLEAAERQGILHRDIKPSNIFVGAAGELKVGDFGLSRPVEPAGEMRLTQTGLFIGTPVCSSPEQLLGEALDVRSDIYAVGATLYYLLTGAFPFSAGNAARLIAQVISEDPTPLAHHGVSVPPAVEQTLMTCLARKPDERWASYAQLRSALEASLPQSWAPVEPVRRFAAAFLDTVLIDVVLATPLTLAIGAGESVGQAVTSNGLPLVAALGLGIMEGVVGFTPGKRLLKLRVIANGGGSAGWRAGLVRAAVVSADSWLMLLLLVGGVVSRDQLETHSSLWFWVLPALLFLRARTANGWRAEHDRWTGTRVVTNQPRTVERTRDDHVRSGLLSRPVPVAMVGEYQVSAHLDSPDSVLLARDLGLGRPVWLVSAAPPVGTAAHTVHLPRVSAPRFLETVVTDTGSWDVYAAVDGESLHERLQRPCQWPVIRRWLLDLASEVAARAVAPMPDDASAHLLITPDDQLLWVPFRLAGGAPAHGGDDPDGPHPFRHFAQAILAAPREDTRRALPPKARALLDALTTGAPTPDTVRHAIAATRAVSGAVSRPRRFGTALVCALSLAGVTAWFVGTRTAQERDRDALVDFTTWIAADPAPSASTAGARGDRDAFATYLAARVAVPAGGDSTRAALQAAVRKRLTVREEQLFDSLLAAHPRPSPRDSVAADRRLLAELRATPPGMITLGVRSALGFVFAIALMTSLLTLTIAVVGRRGLMLRLLRLDLVDDTGAPASRWRLCLRLLLIAAPAAVGWWAVPLMRLQPRASLYVMGLVVGTILLWIWSAWRNPSRSLLERLSGTWMVRT
jgi:uncharacterized RDD family membrane protein YckC